MRESGKRRIWTLVGVAAFLLVVGRVGVAGPADYAKLAPATHEAFIYVDVGQILKSKLYQDLRPTLFDQNTSMRLVAIEQFTGIRLPDDISIVAASGKIAQNNEGCLFLKGRWDRQRIEGFLKMNPGYTEITKPAGKVISFLDENKGTTNYLAFLSDNLLAVGNNAAVESALNSFAGKGPSLAQNATVQAYLSAAPTSPVAMVVALRPATLPGNIAGQPGIRNLKSAVLEVLDGPTAISVIVQVEADSQAMAAKWLDIARGVIALGQIQDKVPKLAEIANQATAAQRGAVVEVKAQVKTADAGDFLRQKIAEDRQRKAMGGARVGQGQGQGQTPPPAPAQW